MIIGTVLFFYRKQHPFYWLFSNGGRFGIKLPVKKNHEESNGFRQGLDGFKFLSLSTCLFWKKGGAQSLSRMNGSMLHPEC